MTPELAALSILLSKLGNDYQSAPPSASSAVSSAGSFGRSYRPLSTLESLFQPSYRDPRNADVSHLTISVNPTRPDDKDSAAGLRHSIAPGTGTLASRRSGIESTIRSTFDDGDDQTTETCHELAPPGTLAPLCEHAKAAMEKDPAAVERLKASLERRKGGGGKGGGGGGGGKGGGGGSSGKPSGGNSNSGGGTGGGQSYVPPVSDGGGDGYSEETDEEDSWTGTETAIVAGSVFAVLATGGVICAMCYNKRRKRGKKASDVEALEAGSDQQELLSYVRRSEDEEAQPHHDDQQAATGIAAPKPAHHSKNKSGFKDAAGKVAEAFAEALGGLS